MMEAIDWFVEGGWELAQLLGPPVLFVIFIIKGALVGKIFPTSLFLPGYVVFSGASIPMALVIVVVTAGGYIIGQYIVYTGSRRYGRSYVSRLPYTTVNPDSDKFDRFDDWFTEYGGISIFVLNFVPWVRGLVTIPAATSSYSPFWYVFHTTTSTMLYHGIYVAMALAGVEAVT